MNKDFDEYGGTKMVNNELRMNEFLDKIRTPEKNQIIISKCIWLMKRYNLFTKENISILESHEECKKHGFITGKTATVLSRDKDGNRYSDSKIIDMLKIGEVQYYCLADWYRDNRATIQAFTKWLYEQLDVDDNDKKWSSLMGGIWNEMEEDLNYEKSNKDNNDLNTGTRSNEIDRESSLKSNRNLIYFGAPGTGKSYTLNGDRKKLVGENRKHFERVTFHPDYSYAHFVGTYKPVPEGKDITYKYVPGPFMRVYVAAKNDPNQKYLLIIEEINRANVAAVFGDIFQLLDRTKDGKSEYPIAASEDIKAYIKEFNDKMKSNVDCETLSIPSNMYIWATMNSADQGVFPMDTAFKRRWDFKYMDINAGQDAITGKLYIGKGGKYKLNWNELRTKINEWMNDKKINEDKQLGPFFISKDIVDESRTKPSEEETTTFHDAFKSKVLMYLFEDAAKQKRDKLFGGNKRYSEICSHFDDKGIVGLFNGINVDNIQFRVDNSEKQNSDSEENNETDEGGNR